MSELIDILEETRKEAILWADGVGGKEGMDADQAATKIKALAYGLYENVIGDRAAKAAYNAGLGVSEWESFLSHGERRLLAKFKEELEKL